MKEKNHRFQSNQAEVSHYLEKFILPSSLFAVKRKKEKISSAYSDFLKRIKFLYL